MDHVYQFLKIKNKSLLFNINIYCFRNLKYKNKKKEIILKFN